MVSFYFSALRASEAVELLKTSSRILILRNFRDEEMETTGCRSGVIIACYYHLPQMTLSSGPSISNELMKPRTIPYSAESSAMLLPTVIKLETLYFLSTDDTAGTQVSRYTGTQASRYTSKQVSR